MEKHIIIHKAIMHVLDTTLTQPVLSDLELEIDDEIYEYLQKQIEKTLHNPNNKKYILQNNSENCEMLLNFKDEDFIETTQILSKNIFGIMSKVVDINPGNLVFVLFENENTKKICMLKMDYKTSFIYKIDEYDEKRINRIVKYKTNLPNIGQKPEESFLYEIDNGVLYVNEKKYEIEEEKTTIFSNFIFNLPFNLSPKETFDAIEKVSKKMVKEYFDNDIEKKIKVKKEIVDSFNEKGTVDLEKITEKAFEHDAVVKQVYTEELSQRGIRDNNVKLDYKLDKNINKKQKIKTDEGIEILIPVEYLDDTDKISFNTNEDGTINIIIKSLNNIG